MASRACAWLAHRLFALASRTSAEWPLWMYPRRVLCLPKIWFAPMRGSPAKKARIGANQIFGRHNTRRGYIQSGHSADVRLASANSLWANQAQALDAIVFAAFLQCCQVFLFLRVGGYDEFSAGAIGNFMLLAEFVHHAVARDAQARLQRILLIVDSRMDDSAIARTGGHANARILLHQKDILPALRKHIRGGAADHAAADDQDIRLIHFSILLVAADGVEVGFARSQAGFSAVVDRVGGLLVFFVSIAPQRSGAVHAIFIERVEIDVKGSEFFLVVVVVVRNARQRFHARIAGRHSFAHHFDDGVAAGNFYVFLAFASRARRTDFIVHAAARADDR